MFRYPHGEDSFFSPDSDEIFFLGSALLAAPVLHRGATHVNVTFPRDSFYNFYSEKSYSPGEQVQIPTPVWHGAVGPGARADVEGGPPVPLFIRAGSILPVLAEVHIASSRDARAVQLVVALDAACGAKGFLYVDDGFSTDFVVRGHVCEVSLTASMGDGARAAVVVTGRGAGAGCAFINSTTPFGVVHSIAIRLRHCDALSKRTFAEATVISSFPTSLTDEANDEGRRARVVRRHGAVEVENVRIVQSGAPAFFWTVNIR